MADPTSFMKNKNLSGNLFSKPKGGLTIKETPLSSSIAEWLDVNRIYNDRLNSGNVEVVKKFPDKNGQWREYRNWIQLAKKGTPDRFAIWCGYIIFIEVKQKGKTASPEQIERHEELRRAGAHVILTDSLDDFIIQFNERRSFISQRVKAALGNMP